MGLDNVVGLVRNLMQMSAKVGDVGDDGDVPSLWSQLPKIVVVGGQVRQAGLRHTADPAQATHLVQTDN